MLRPGRGLLPAILTVALTAGALTPMAAASHVDAETYAAWLGHPELGRQADAAAARLAAETARAPAAAFEEANATLLDAFAAVGRMAARASAAIVAAWENESWPRVEREAAGGIEIFNGTIVARACELDLSTPCSAARDALVNIAGMLSYAGSLPALGRDGLERSQEAVHHDTTVLVDALGRVVDDPIESAWRVLLEWVIEHSPRRAVENASAEAAGEAYGEVARLHLEHPPAVCLAEVDSPCTLQREVGLQYNATRDRAIADGWGGVAVLNASSGAARGTLLGAHDALAARLCGVKEELEGSPASEFLFPATVAIPCE